MSQQKPNDTHGGPSSPSSPPGPGIRAVAANDALHDAEARLRAVFDHSIQLMAVLAPDGVVVDANRAASEFIGGAGEALIGRPVWDNAWARSQADSQERMRADIARAAAGEIVRFELEITAPDGLTHTIDLSIKPVHDEAGAVAFLIMEGRDVTEAKWAERALRLGEARFAGMIAIASDAIISVDENFVITLFNQGAEAMFGYRADEILGQPLELLLPERHRGVHPQHMRNFAASPINARRMGERQEIGGRRKDGSEFPAEAAISKLNLFGSMIFSIVMRDITERKRVERAQRFLAQAGTILASSLEFETTLASVAQLTVPELADWSVVYIRDDTGTVRRLEVAHADPARRDVVAELLQYPLDPRTPHPVFAVLDTGEPALLADIDDAFLASISHTPQQLDIYRTLGMRSMIIVPLRAHGTTRGAMAFNSATPRRYGPDELAVARDLAVISALAVDNARLYRDATAAVQARDDLIAVVSHDLGNPLSAIRIGTSLLLRSVPKEEQTTGAWAHLEFIRQSAQQMETLINDLLDVKRLEAGKVTLKLRAVDVDGVVNDVLDVFRPIAAQHSLTLEWNPQLPLPPVEGDHQRLVQVLSNLVGNAVKFTEPGGRITLGARVTATAVLFTVSDTGRGIAQEHLAHVFDRFWQVRREGKSGLGLGLAIARGIIDAHGGRIWVESAVGAGSTFLFTVPLAVNGGSGEELSR